MELANKYNPAEVEEKIYQFWLENQFFKSVPDDREPYTVVIPPPNVTGVLHMGHMLNNTIQDILVRRARMQGKNACWVPGTDHASIATEAKVVAKLAEQGIDKKELTREEFLNHAWDWTHKHGGIILEQLKKLGCSCDWDRTCFTMDEIRSKSVIKVFCDLYEKGLIYRGVRMVNWDPKALTAVSDEEVIHKEVNGKLYYLRYKIADENKTTIFEIVKKIIDEWDPYDLLLGGTPNDEFDAESKEISNKISIESNVEDIANIISSVFSEWFDDNEHFAVENCIEIADKIKNAMKINFSTHADLQSMCDNGTDCKSAPAYNEYTAGGLLDEFQSELSGFSEEKLEKIKAVLKKVAEEAEK